MKGIVFLCIACLITVSYAQFPIPKIKPFAIGNARPVNDPKPQVAFDLFIDLSCSDSRDWWLNEFVPKLYPYYFKSSNVYPDITMTITIFPLPYHISAFDLCEASYIIRQFNSTKYLDFVTNLYMNFDSIDTPNVEGKTRYEIRDVIYSTMVQPYGVSRSIYNQQMQSVDLWNTGRYSFKYAVSRSVFGTPSFFVNGVQLANLDDPSFDNLKKIFDSLLSK